MSLRSFTSFLKIGVLVCTLSLKAWAVETIYWVDGKVSSEKAYLKVMRSQVPDRYDEFGDPLKEIKTDTSGKISSTVKTQRFRDQKGTLYTSTDEEVLNSEGRIQKKILSVFVQTNPIVDTNDKEPRVQSQVELATLSQCQKMDSAEIEKHLGLAQQKLKKVFGQSDEIFLKMSSDFSSSFQSILLIKSKLQEAFIYIGPFKGDISLSFSTKNEVADPKDILTLSILDQKSQLFCTWQHAEPFAYWVPEAMIKIHLSAKAEYHVERLR